MDEQVGLYTRSCTTHIQTLEQSISNLGQSTPQLTAHMHGVVSILIIREETFGMTEETVAREHFQMYTF